jgi:hypothetical protein
MTNFGEFREWWEYMTLFAIISVFFSNSIFRSLFSDLFTVPSRRRNVRVAEYTVVSPPPSAPLPALSPG